MANQPHPERGGWMAIGLANVNFYRWNGAVALKPWRKSFPGYNSEKQQQLSESEPWHMHSLIRSANPWQPFSILTSLLMLPDSIENLSMNVISSGEPTPANILVRLLTALARKSGVGAGWTAGLLLALGRSGFIHVLPIQKKRRPSKAQHIMSPSSQREKYQFQLNPLFQMGKEPRKQKTVCRQRLEDKLPLNQHMLVWKTFRHAAQVAALPISRTNWLWFLYICVLNLPVRIQSELSPGV